MNRPPSSRERRVAALTIERFGPVSTLHLERVHYAAIPARKVPVKDTPEDIKRRQRQLVEATKKHPTRIPLEPEMVTSGATTGETVRVGADRATRSSRESNEAGRDGARVVRRHIGRTRAAG